MNEELDPADVWEWLHNEAVDMQVEASTVLDASLDFDTALEMVLERCRTHHTLECQIMDTLNPCNR